MVNCLHQLTAGSLQPNQHIDYLAPKLESYELCMYINIIFYAKFLTTTLLVSSFMHDKLISKDWTEMHSYQLSLQSLGTAINCFFSHYAQLSTVSSVTLGLPVLLRSLLVSLNFTYQHSVLLTSGVSHPYLFLSFCWATTGKFVLRYYKTHWIFSFIDTILMLMIIALPVQKNK